MKSEELIVNFNNFWSLAIHEVSTTTIKIWFGTLNRNLKKVDDIFIELHTVKPGTYEVPDQIVTTKQVSLQDWQRPFDKIDKMFYMTSEFKGLQSNVRYVIIVYRKFVDADGHVENKMIAKGSAVTLANKLDDYTDGLVVAMGSCYYAENDENRTTKSFEALAQNGKKLAPHIKFMTGDQVYLDIGFDSLSLDPGDIRERVAADYQVHWKALRGWLRNGGTWFLPDDHEYWNDYPNVAKINPFVVALNVNSVRKAWEGAARNGVKNVQQIEPVRTFDIGSDLSFCLADLRSWRSDNNFTAPDYMTQLLQWINDLQTPGVLVVPQTIITALNPHEKNLASFPVQYGELVSAIANASHDILVLTGDIHYGRISEVAIGGNGRVLREVVSSPLSNLTYLSSPAASSGTKKNMPKKFPPYKVSGLVQGEVNHFDKKWHVQTTRRDLPDYWKSRTKEHFMTLNFKKLDTGEVKVAVQAWFVREKTGKLPKRNWKSPYTFNMK